MLPLPVVEDVVDVEDAVQVEVASIGSFLVRVRNRPISTSVVCAGTADAVVEAFVGLLLITGCTG